MSCSAPAAPRSARPDSAWTQFPALSAAHDRPIYAAIGDAPAANRRPVVVADQMDVHAATLRALDILGRSETGSFLVVEWDAHTDDPREGLQSVVDSDCSSPRSRAASI